MFLMYVDESGDSGLQNSPTRYFILSGLVIHELRWTEYLNQLIQFRRNLRDKFGLKMREEIHASAFITNPGELIRIKRYDRLAILRMFADELATMPELNAINIVVDKQNKSQNYDVFENAWGALLQRFENTMRSKNFRGPANTDERGLIVPDATDNKKLTTLLRKMRRHNYVPYQGKGQSRNVPLQYLIEDPFFKDSANSLFTQCVDLIAYLLYQKINPNSYMKQKSGHNYFERLEPILCKVASKNDPLGIVTL